MPDRTMPRPHRGGFGDPIERGAVTLLPVLSPRGRVRGAYVMTGDDVRWEPAFNLNRAILVGNISWWVTVAFAWWFIWSRRAARENRANGESVRTPSAPAHASTPAVAGHAIDEP